jgi:para-nitrobenzyl esterase
MAHQWIQRYSLGLLSLLAQLGCDSAEQPQQSHSDTTEKDRVDAGGDAMKGRLIGVRVSGLTYRTPTMEGTTDAAGSFAYRDNEQVRFSIGELVLGSLEGSAELTLGDLLPERTDNLLVLLTTLDRDGSLNNGIEIDPAIAKLVTQYKDKIELDQDTTAFAADEDLKALLGELNEAELFTDTDPRPRTLKSAAAAHDYFTRTTAQRKPVDTRYGNISGYAANETTFQWLGVPYARPPLNELRWKPTEELQPWTGTRDAVDWGDQAAQNPEYQSSGEGGMSEDCLYLNVTAPADAKDLPVMVWFHGGAFTILSGNSKSYNNIDSVTTKGVVLVTVNHRLGPFGYLAHPWLAEESEYGGSGNYGQMDLVMALKWVKENIAGFGGDPSNVTIFGQSGGCGKVAALMMSERAVGLFHQAACQSGSTAFSMASKEEVIAGAEKVGEDLFTRLGVESIEQARAKSWVEIIQSEVDAMIPREVYRPTVDNYYLSKTYYETLLDGQPSDVPLLVGATAGDYPNLRSGLQAAMPLRAAHSRAPLYVYKFTRVPAGLDAKGVPSCHGCELPYLFNYPAMFVNNYRFNLVLDPATGMKPDIADLDEDGTTGTDGDNDDVLAALEWDEADDKVADTLMTVWTNFAKTSNPSTDDLTWPPYSTDNDQYVDFGQSNIEVKSTLGEAFP